MIISTAPGYEDFASTLLSTPNAENVVLHVDGQPDRTIRAIVRQKTQTFSVYGGNSAKADINALRIAPFDAVHVPEGARFTVRGAVYYMAVHGLRPDGVALVAVDLETTPR
ncbi:hypothetical protein GHL01_00390 [Sinorhizobium meliloti]|uniref:head-tail joining protein n=1 Tax=Rhizobium meliloti TaxID=382 RepID=UPI001296FCBF|nr:hypothetical protein [Sinorhizobium meliloti]MQV12203.1 hypothetical protein [Sinorhizobium meliloti]